MYKWVDKSGQVHYSQIPPDKDQIKDNSDVTEKRANVIRATRKGDYAYCGDLKLPGPLYQPKTILLSLSYSVDSWKRSLRSTESSLTRQLRELDKRNRQENSRYRNHSTYNEQARDRRRKTSRQITEYQCALAWAESQKSKHSGIKETISHNFQGAKSSHQKALNLAIDDCGAEPKNFNNPDYGHMKVEWKKCMRPHKRKIRTSERNLNRLRKQANKLEY